MTAKTRAIASLHRDSFLAKAHGQMAGWLCRVMFPTPTTGPLAKIFSNLKDKVMKRIFLIIFCSCAFLTFCSKKDETCVITGKVINRPQSTELRLTKGFVDFRSPSAVIIPIKDSSFRFELHFKESEAYNLVFADEYSQGRINLITFFTNDGKVDMELHALKDFNKNIVSGGRENNEFHKYIKDRNDAIERDTKSINDSLQFLQSHDKYRSQLMKDLYKKLENAEKADDKYKISSQINELYTSGKGLSSAAQKFSLQNDSVMEIVQANENKYIRENITIPNYYILIQDILTTGDRPNISLFNELCAIQNKYKSKFKNHPYTIYSNEVIWRFANMKPGGDFFDFSLPDLDGRGYTLSKEIKGKYAIIDIWAPWCGPCISRSRELIPLFEDFKNKGFTVIGIASKYQEIGDVKNLLLKENYPWITLIDKSELDSRINENYGIEMAGGESLLVDKNGKIVLLNPSVEEVRKILEANL